MSAKSFTCPKCGTKSTVQRIQDNNYACTNSRCDLHARLVAHVDLSANGKVTKVYGWLLERGTILSQRYLIEKLLGKGGFGATYLARDRKMFDKICAIKEIPLLYFDEQEEEFLTRLDHPAIPKLIERFNVNGLHYSVMEYFEGNGLDTLVKKSSPGLPETTVLKIADPLCNVLSYIHSQKVIHRDLKPENILVGKDNSIALIDFGIAKQYDLGKGTRRLARAASCFYSSPEQYQAGKGYTDMKSDIYSFGAILYFLITGKEPVDALSRAATRDIEPTPRQLNPKISKHVEQVIIKALKMHKQDRFTSVQQMKKALFQDQGKFAEKCQKCGTTLKEPGNFCPHCGHSTSQLSKTPLETFVFRSGDRASTLQEFVEKCYLHWEDAKWHLLRGDFIEWLEKQSEKAMSRKARLSKNRKTDSDHLLNEFLLTSKFGTPPQLHINQNKFEFLKVPQGQTQRGSLRITNSGKGLLKGEIKSAAKWLILNARTFSCKGGESYPVSFSVETDRLVPNREYKTGLLLTTNVAKTEIPVSVTVVQPPFQPKIDPGRIYLQLKPGKSTTVELNIDSGNRQSFQWQAKSVQDWIQVTPASFKAQTKKIGVEISAKNLPEGKYSGQLQFSAEQKVLPVHIDLLVTPAARNEKTAPPLRPFSQDFLPPVLLMLITALAIGHFGVTEPQPIVLWQVVFFSAVGAYWGIRKNLLIATFGAILGGVLGAFWSPGLYHLHTLIKNHLLQPICIWLNFEFSLQPVILGWGLFGLYLGVLMALVRIFTVRRRWFLLFLGLLGVSFLFGMVFWGLPYLVSG